MSGLILLAALAALIPAATPPITTNLSLSLIGISSLPNICPASSFSYNIKREKQTTVFILRTK
jgi:hypothetical protein